MCFFYCGTTALSISVFIGFICFNKNWNGPLISTLASLKKKRKENLSNIWESVVWNTQTYNGIRKSFSLWWLIYKSILMGNFTKGKGEFCQVCDSCGASLLQPQVWGGGGFWETAVPRWAATFCLQRASSLDREKGQRDKCQMASSVTPYEMPLIVARRRPFTATSGGKTGVSWLQGRRQRCADAVNDIRPRTCKQFWKWNGDTARPEIFPESPAPLKSTGITAGEMVVFVCPTSTLLFLWTLARLFLGETPHSPLSVSVVHRR